MNKKEQIKIAEKKLKELKEEQEKIEKPKKGKDFAWYEYDQNNSGGSFDDNEDVCVSVYIEASSLEEANAFADSLGIYFNGCDTGMDCSCCGDRWHEPWDNITFPYRYSSLSLEEAEKTGIEYKPTNWVQAGTDKPDPNRYDLIFHSIGEYATYLLNKDSFGFRTKIYLYDRKRVKKVISKNGR